MPPAFRPGQAFARLSSAASYGIRLPRRALLVGLTLCCCVGATPRSARVQNETGDDGLTALASDTLAEQLQAHGIEATEFELIARLEALSEGGLQIQILCSTRDGHLLKARVQVKARGASPRRLLRPLMGEAAKNLAADCR